MDLTWILIDVSYFGWSKYVKRCHIIFLLATYTTILTAINKMTNNVLSLNLRDQ